MRKLGGVLLSLALAGCAGVKYEQIPVEPELLPDEQYWLQWAEKSKSWNEQIRREPEESRRAGLRRDKAKALHELMADFDKQNADIRAGNRAADAAHYGIRYYRPSPYLLVYSDGKDGLVWEIHYLPDPTKRMSAKPFNFLASLKWSLDFDAKGYLKSAKDVADATAVPKAVINAVESLAPVVAPGILEATREAKAGHGLPAPFLFKIIAGPEGIELRGGKAPLDAVEITLLSTSAIEGR